MKTYRILILEDDLETLSVILKSLTLLEGELERGNTGKDIAVTILSEYWQVEDYLNKSTKEKFDLILLDRDCKAGGSFHTLDFNKFKGAEIIGISSVPEYNELLRKKGIQKIIDKTYQDLETFSIRLTGLIEEIIRRKYRL